MPNLRCFLARFWLSDNQMTIILKVYIISYNLCIGEISIKKFGTFRDWKALKTGHFRSLCFCSGSILVLLSGGIMGFCVF